MPDSIDEEEQKRYWPIFKSCLPVDGLISGDRVVQVLKASNLDDSTLEKVWDLADIDQDGQLDFEEFCVAMHLTFQVLNGNGKEIPEQLSASLIPKSKAHLFQNFDWYISPAQRTKYVEIYESVCDSNGQFNFDSLKDLYKELNLSESQLERYWRLVNPNNQINIDQEQAQYFLHILEQGSRGLIVPSQLPPSLAKTFTKSNISTIFDKYNSKSKANINTLKSRLDDRNTRISNVQSPESQDSKHKEVTSQIGSLKALLESRKQVLAKVEAELKSMTN